MFVFFIAAFMVIGVFSMNRENNRAAKRLEELKVLHEKAEKHLQEYGRVYLLMLRKYEITEILGKEYARLEEGLKK